MSLRSVCLEHIASLHGESVIGNGDSLPRPNLSNTMLRLD